MDYISTNDIETQVLEAMTKMDILPSNTSLTVDGKVHRYDVEGDKPKSRNGFYCIYPDGLPAGYFGSWKVGESVRWIFDTRGLEPNKRKMLLNIEKTTEYKKLQAEREKELKNSQAKAADKARVIFEQSSSANPEHPYLVRKQIAPYGIRQLGNDLLIPLRDENGKFRSMQRINANPEIPKLFEAGTSTKGAFFSIGGDIKEGVILICEGYATAATLHELTGFMVIAAFSCYNLGAVAPKIKKMHPSRKIFIASDNDHNTKGNPGLSCAQEAVKQFQLDGLIYPQDIKGTDWNDFYIEHGIDKAEKKIKEEIAKTIQANDFFTIIDDDPIPVEYIGGIFPRGDITVFFGKAGSGKTLFLDCFTRELSQGGQILDGIFDKEEPPRKIIFLEADTNKKLFATRKFDFKWGGNLKNLKHVFSRELLKRNDFCIDIGEESGKQFIQNIAERERPDLIIFDTLQGFHLLDENKSSDMKKLFFYLVKLASDFNCAIVVTHHARKSNQKFESKRLSLEDAQGTNILLRQTSTVISLEKVKVGDTTKHVFSRLKTWNRPTQNDWFAFSFKEENIYTKTLKLDFEIFPSVGDNKSDLLRRTILEREGYFSKEEIKVSFPNINESLIEKNLSELTGGRIIEKIGKGRYTKYLVKNIVGK